MLKLQEQNLRYIFHVALVTYSTNYSGDQTLLGEEKSLLFNEAQLYIKSTEIFEYLIFMNLIYCIK